MVIKLSDYILEQSTSDASINDIELEQLVAEMDVCCKLAMAYNKQLLMESYFQEQNPVAPAPEPAPTQPGTPVGAQEPLVQKPAIMRVHGAVDNHNVHNDVNKEGGFFKTIIFYIKRFFKWVGLKLTGMSDDAIKNMRFIEYYILNAPEEKLNLFIQNNKINIEMYNPNKLTKFVTDITTATNQLENSINTIGKLSFDSTNKKAVTARSNQIGAFDKAIKDFSVAIHQTELEDQQNFTDRVNELQTFKTYVQQYAALFKQKNANITKQEFYKQLTECGKKLIGLSDSIDKILTNEVYSGDNAEAVQLKAMFDDLKKQIGAASKQVTKITTSYADLKKLAFEIKGELSKPENMKRGQIETKWANAT